jgi:hypothetical protein
MLLIGFLLGVLVGALLAGASMLRAARKGP